MASLQFPLDYSKHQSMIGFQPMKISPISSPGNLEVTGTGEWAWLPVPPSGLTTDYKQGWGQQTAGAMKTGISSITSAVFGGEGFGGKWDAVKENTGKMFGGTDFGGVGRGMLEKFTGTGGISQAMLEQAFVSYTGPEYRSHSFAFSLYPKNPTESKAVEDILTFFKKFSAPIQRGGNLVRLYDVPHIFEISFVPDDGLYAIKACALESIEVKYGGEKYKTFRDTNKPVQTDLTLAFKEMHLLTAQDFGGDKDTATTSSPPPQVDLKGIRGGRSFGNNPA